MPRTLDLESWPRREHFDFFRTFAQPFWNLTAEVDVTALHRATKERGISYFLSALHASLEAVNAVEALRQRLRPGSGGPDGTPEVIVHDIVHSGSTVLRADDTFTFVYFDYVPDLATFLERAKPVLEEARGSSGRLEPAGDRDDLVHSSVIPWVAFTSFQHARDFRPGPVLDSVPKIVFGRHHLAADGRRRMPVSIEVHHALVDGLHVGRFFERFQRNLDAPLPGH